jgi:hypothetical protein
MIRIDEKIRKLVVVFAVTFFMATALAGLAAAMPAQIHILPEGEINLVPGEYVETTAHLYDMYCDGSTRTLAIAVSSGTPSDLKFKIAGDTNVGDIEYSYTPVAGTKTYDIQVEIQAATGTEGNDYTLYYEDVQDGVWDVASATVHTTAIPEFATIAIPVVSILGLLFFFNYRKHKKE